MSIRERRCFIIQNSIEIWKPIIGYEGLYEISNFGRVRNASQKIIKVQINNRGYYRIRLCKNGKYEQYFIHRLVAITFIPNKDISLEVNHKDENKLNNKVDNLEWVTRKENMNRGTVQDRIHKGERLNLQKEIAKNNNEMRSKLIHIATITKYDI